MYDWWTVRFYPCRGMTVAHTATKVIFHATMKVLLSVCTIFALSLSPKSDEDRLRLGKKLKQVWHFALALHYLCHVKTYTPAQTK